MSHTARICATLAVIAGVVVLALWLSGFGRKSPSPPAETPSVQGIMPAKTNKPSIFAKRGVARTDATPSADTSIITNWEDKLDEVLRADGETDEKGRTLLEMFARLPPAGQVEVAPHIANLISDEDFSQFGAYLTNTTTSVEVHDTIMADLLGRPNAIKLPLLLEVARTPGHEKASEAKELLELYLEKDYGDHWDEWRAKMEEWLKENPD